MKCTDCNGNKFYEGLGHFGDVREYCSRCKGSGKEPGNSISRLGTTGTPIRRGDSPAYRARGTGGLAELMTKVSIQSVSANQSSFPDTIRLETTQHNGGYFTHHQHPDGTLVKVTNSEEGLHWVMLGVRAGSGLDKDPLGWDTQHQTEAVMLPFAQAHYLALYKRINMDNRFQCIWHY